VPHCLIYLKDKIITVLYGTWQPSKHKVGDQVDHLKLIIFWGVH